MKQKFTLFIVLAMSVAVSPVYAQGGHGSHGSMEQGSSQAPSNSQNAEETKKILSNCAQYVTRIEQRIQKLQMETNGGNVGSTIRDELKKLEENLKEANDIVRSLQIL